MKSVKEIVTIEELIAQLPEKYTEADRELVLRAYRVAEEAHRPQKRHSGEPYVTHCVAVAKILADLKMSPEVVAAGLLHDTVEDTYITLEDVKRDFGDTIAGLVDGVTKLTHLPRVSRGDQHAEESASADRRTEELTPAPALGRKEDVVSETLRKTFIAMGKDMRVMFIKLADRLHNMRTLDFAPEHKRKRVAQQTLEIFAPVANRLGIWQIKWELEDLGLQYVNPEKYNEIARMLTQKRQEREQQIEAIKEKISTLLKEHNIKAEVSGRPKHIYSIYRKMQRKGRSFGDLLDIRAVRVIVADAQACYGALGFIHAKWRPIPGEFDDYVAAPKNNFYQSLHTTVVYEDGSPLEIQIRTQEMHVKAEMGVAAHWRYKEHDKQFDKSYETFINSLRMADLEAEARNAAEFVESVRSDVFQDRIYVFTPRGDIIDLPTGATPIDFAYHVHTDIGHYCRGARINGKLANLNQELKTGDRVEILKAKRNPGPSRDWLNPNLGLVHTQRAISKIKEWFRKQGDNVNLAQGRATLETELHRLGLLDKVNYEKMARSLNFKTPDEMFLALGKGDITITKVLREVGLDEEKERKEPEEDAVKVSPPSAPDTSTKAIQVVGLRDMLSVMAKCCSPMPGDQIIGYVTRGRGVTIHRRDCPNILRTQDHERLLQVTWGPAGHTYPVPIRIKAYDRPGLMNDVAKLLSDENINITDLEVKTLKPIANINLIIEVKDISQLSRVLNRVDKVQNIIEVHRSNPG